MIKKISLLISTLCTLVGCSNSGSSSSMSYTFKMISPTGAPAVSVYEEVLNHTCETNDNAQNVLPQLKNDEYDFVIFETYKGLQTIQSGNSNYKLARILTGGNIYLLGLNKEENSVPSKEDYIVSFSKDSLPDLAFKSIYGDIVDDYLANNTLLQPILKTGLYSSKTVDYLIMAEPAISNILLNKPEYLTKVSIKCLREEYGNKYKTDNIIPQAGLFVNYVKYQENKQIFDNFLKKIDSGLDALIADSTLFKTKNSEISDVDQVKMYGFTSKVVENVQSNNKNGLGLVSSNEYKNFSLNNFLNNVGVKTDFSQFIM